MRFFRSKSKSEDDALIQRIRESKEFVVGELVSSAKLLSLTRNNQVQITGNWKDGSVLVQLKSEKLQFQVREEDYFEKLATSITNVLTALVVKEFVIKYDNENSVRNAVGIGIGARTSLDGELRVGYSKANDAAKGIYSQLNCTPNSIPNSAYKDEYAMSIMPQAFVNMAHSRFDDLRRFGDDFFNDRKTRNYTQSYANRFRCDISAKGTLSVTLSVNGGGFEASTSDEKKQSMYFCVEASFWERSDIAVLSEDNLRGAFLFTYGEEWVKVLNKMDEINERYAGEKTLWKQIGGNKSVVCLSLEGSRGVGKSSLLWGLQNAQRGKFCVPEYAVHDVPPSSSQGTSRSVAQKLNIGPIEIRITDNSGGNELTPALFQKDDLLHAVVVIKSFEELEKDCKSELLRCGVGVVLVTKPDHILGFAEDRLIKEAENFGQNRWKEVESWCTRHAKLKLENTVQLVPVELPLRHSQHMTDARETLPQEREKSFKRVSASCINALVFVLDDLIKRMDEQIKSKRRAHAMMKSCQTFLQILVVTAIAAYMVVK